MTVHHHCVTLRWWPGDYSLILFSSALCILTMFDIFIGTHTIFVHCNDGICYNLCKHSMIRDTVRPLRGWLGQ